MDKLQIEVRKEMIKRSLAVAVTDLLEFEHDLDTKKYSTPKDRAVDEYAVSALKELIVALKAMFTERNEG